jgi:hypothetical protein
MGGERQKIDITYSKASSAKVHCTGRTYLERISNSMHVPIEGRPRIGCTITQKQCCSL